jgi:hypothetical protein
MPSSGYSNGFAVGSLASLAQTFFAKKIPLDRQFANFLTQLGQPIEAAGAVSQAPVCLR